MKTEAIVEYAILDLITEDLYRVVEVESVLRSRGIQDARDLARRFLAELAKADEVEFAKDVYGDLPRGVDVESGLVAMSDEASWGLGDDTLFVRATGKGIKRFSSMGFPD